MKIALRSILLGLTVCCLLFCKKKEENKVEPQPPEIEKSSTGFLVDTASVGSYSDSAIKEVIGYFPDLKMLQGEIKYNVKAYKITYRTNYKGNEVIASGLICVPQTGNIRFPVFSYQHGTIFKDNEAPTEDPIQQIQIGALASAGYLAVAPDYLGFGTANQLQHPYYEANYSANAVRHLLLAAKEFAKLLKIDLSGQLYLAGYSQGGNVTMASLKSLEKEPIEGLTVTASAAGAGGYNLLEIFHTIFAKQVYASPNYLGYVIQSYRTAYDFAQPLSYYFKEPYASKIPSMYNGSFTGGEINAQLTTQLNDLIQPNFIMAITNGTDVEMRNALTKNSLHDWKPTKPLRFYHGDADEVVPFSDTDSTYKHMKALGATQVTFIPLPGKKHGTGALPMIADALTWFKSFQ